MNRPKIFRFLASLVAAGAAMPIHASGAGPIQGWLAHRLADPAAPPAPYLLTARLGGVAVAPALVFRLTNTTADTIRVAPSKLPWGNTDSIQVVVIGADGRAYPNYVLVEELPATEPVVLEPGASLEGEFELNWQVELPPQRARDAIVVWSYSGIVLSGPGPTPVATGAVALPARWPR